MKCKLIILSILTLLFLFPVTAITETPDSLNVTIGVIDEGDLTSIQSDDQNWLNISEVTGTPGFNYTVNFTGTDFEAQALVNFSFVGWYSGAGGHTVNMNVWNYSLNAWQTLFAITDTVTSEDATYSSLPNFCPNWVDGGIIQINIEHASPGNVNHDLYTNFISITGNQTPTLSGTINRLVEVGSLTEFKTGEIVIPTVTAYDADNTILTNISCNISVYDPDMVKVVNEENMTKLDSATGLFQYNYTMPSTKGVYTWQSYCLAETNGKFVASQFQNTTKGGEGMIGIALALIAGLFIVLGTLIDKEISSLVYVFGILLMTASVFSLIFEVEGVTSTQTALLYGVGSGMLWVLVIAIGGLLLYFTVKLLEGILKKV